MGQRSQIYIRYNVNSVSKSGEEKHNYKGLIARYFQWNAREDMISRARYVIQKINDVFLKDKRKFGDNKELKKLIHLCNTNLDTKEITNSYDIIKEVAGYFGGNVECIFNQDNNNGQLFIDVTDDGINYCFMKFYNREKPMDGEQYMKWGRESEDHPDWHVPYEHMSKETISYTENNIRKINTVATLMSSEELKAFLEDDYSYLLK